MKRCFLKIASLTMTAVAAFASFAACGNGGDDQTNINMNIDLNNKIELNVLMPNSGYTIDAVNADYNAKVVEEVTGYKVKYSQLPASDASSSLNTQLIDREPYNAMKLTTSQFADLIANDALLPLDDAIDKFGPVLKDVISEESWDVVTVDGKIYGIPERASSDNIENPIVFRQDWLDELNMSIPTTAEEFKEVLVAMKNEYNIAPLTFDMYTPLIYPISAAFGIYSDWQEYEIDGKKEVRYYMEAPGYADYIDYMADLYKSGLIDAEISTQKSADAIQKFTSGKAGAVATSLWSVSAIVTGLQSNGVITATEAKTTQENVLGYLRSLKNEDGEYKVYRTSGYTYITAIPFYMAENAGYVIDWINSKLTDTEEAHNFRTIVIGEEDTHWTYSESTGYVPVSENFAEKDTASYYLTGSNEKVYTQYWLARVRKQAELFRAWSELMTDADEVGVYNITDFAPPLPDYTAVRGNIELYAQDQFYIMIKSDGGSSKLSQYVEKYRTDGGQKASEAINEWYYGK